MLVYLHMRGTVKRQCVKQTQVVKNAATVRLRFVV